MARLYTNGWEVPNHLDPYVAASAWSWNSDAKYSGAYSLRLGANGYVRAALSGSPTEIYTRDRIRVGVVASAGDIFRVSSDVTTDLFRLSYANNAYLRLVVNGTTRIDTSSVFAPTTDTWYLIEMHLKMADAGTVELRVNGVSLGTWDGDTKPGADIALTSFSIASYLGVNSSSYHDDTAINDVSGSVDNSWCGDGRVIALRPNGAGDSTQWTPVSASNYLDVDEVTPDDDTTYVSTATVGNKDLYALEDATIPTSAVIQRVWVSAVARKTAEDADNVQLGLKAGTTEAWSTDRTLSTAYQLHHGPEYTTNPDDSAAWEDADLDSLQAGIKAV